MIEGIEQGPSVARWQRASELADMLNSSSYGELKRIHEQAASVGEFWIGKSNIRTTETTARKRRRCDIFWPVLGRFEVNDGTDVLLKAAETKRTPNDELGRHSAIEAIAVRAYNLQHIDPPEQLTNPELEPTLIRLAERSGCNYTFRSDLLAPGSWGRRRRSRSWKLRSTIWTRTRATTRQWRSAHRGNAKSVETLAEMLDVSEMASKKAEKPSDEAAATPIRASVR